MGREIRRVPPNWQHPEYDRKIPYFLHPICYKPLFDINYEEAVLDWFENFDRIRKGEMTDDEKKYYPNGLQDWLSDYSPPDPLYYRFYKNEEATWFQMYETTSEGTPVTPPFSTKEKLIEYLVVNGTFYDQQKGEGGWERESAENFVNRGWSPTLVIKQSEDGIKILQPRDGI